MRSNFLTITFFLFWCGLIFISISYSRIFNQLKDFSSEEADQKFRFKSVSQSFETNDPDSPWYGGICVRNSHSTCQVSCASTTAPLNRSYDVLLKKCGEIFSEAAIISNPRHSSRDVQSGEFPPNPIRASLTCRKGNQVALRFGRKWSPLNIKDKNVIQLNPNHRFVYRWEYNNDSTMKIDLWMNNSESGEFLTFQCGKKTNFHYLAQKSNRETEQDFDHEHSLQSKLNVLVLLIDSVSRSHFIREMPKTAKFLQERNHLQNDPNVDFSSSSTSMNKWNSLMFTRHAILGKNSAPNKVPLFAGTSFCGAPRTPTTIAHFPCPIPLHKWIWNQYQSSKLQYLTLYGSTVCQEFCGSRKGAADPKVFEQFDYVFQGPSCSKWNMYSGKIKEGDRMCAGGAPVSQHLLNYTSQVWNVNSNEPKIGVLSFLEAHRSEREAIQQLDDQVLEFLLKNEENMNSNTIVMLLSDHGNHHGLSKIDQSRLNEDQISDMESEHILPLFSMLLPNRFIHENHQDVQNLVHNTDTLTTHYDIYSTLQDLLSKQDPELKSKLPKPEKGQSLFKSIPISRSCHETGVSLDYCPCIQWKKILSKGEDKKNNQYHSISTNHIEFLLSHVNDVIHLNSSNCRRLELNQILSAEIANQSRMENMGNKKFPSQNSYLYRYRFRINPGNAEFSASLFDESESSLNLTNSFKIISISQTTTYRKHEKCADSQRPDLCICNL
eukprot:gb/GECH01001985.1/.p1 GENE.gb/GECH01001985.1/~~gb/GECH01001985.1/.p1  ORF type:complete len:720 (+),score=140.62 gb/GECH01001985.1/:1-2160(+)